jgi:putative ABC transport system substrate-binding protein
MRRRDLMLLLAGAVTVSRGVHAQPKAMPVIGYLSSVSPLPVLLDQFRKGLAEQGYREGRNVAIEYRWAEGRYDRLPGLAAELVRDRVDVIVATGGAFSGRAARAATKTIPIVVESGADPVAAGFTGSLGHPSGNVTGIAQLVTVSEAKRLQLLHELVPGAATIVYLENPALWNAESMAGKARAAAAALGIGLLIVKASNERELAAAFAKIARKRAGALLVGSDPFFFMRRAQLVALAGQGRIPAMYFFREFVTAGGLISYGTRLDEAYHQIGVYTGKILKGAKPADLPIAQQSEKIELVINLKTARALGLTIPPAILARADEVIE